MSTLIAILGGWRATAFAALAVLALSGYGVEHLRRVHAQADLSAYQAQAAQAQIVAEQAARKREYESTVAMDAIAKQYEDAKHDVQTDADRTAADLRAGTLKLREQWQGCQADRVSNAAASAAELDGLNRLRGQGASDLVRVVATCQAQRDGLQAVVAADRKR